MSKPILALIPSGYKATKVYSVLPNDGDGDFTFARTGEATRVRKDGLIEAVATTVPRLDWLNSNCPSLLLEPTRTNIQAFSENFGGAAWSAAFSTVTANSSISPNGELTAYNFKTTTSAGLLTGSATIVANTIYSYSLYVKANTTNICKVLIFDADSGGSATPYGTIQFDMSNETITSSLGTASFDKLDDGWYRLQVTGTSPNPLGGGATGVQISLTEIGSVFIWGAQMEAAPYASSYIKNDSSVSGVTRLKDECSGGGDSALFSITQGTFYADVTPFNSDLSILGISDGTDTNRLQLMFYGSGGTFTNKLRVLGQGDSSASLDRQFTMTMGARKKILVTFKENEAKVYINGSLEFTDTAYDMPTGLNELEFRQYNSSNTFEGKVHDVRVYDRVLTQSEAIELTT